MKEHLRKEEQNRQFHLGYTMAFVDVIKRRNWNNIAALWKSAATAGHKRAQFYLGTCYDHGLGVKKDVRQAFKWFLKAASKNDPKALYNLGLCHKHGHGGSKYVRWAKHYFERARLLGHKEAARQLKALRK